VAWAAIYIAWAGAGNSANPAALECCNHNRDYIKTAANDVRKIMAV